MVIKKKIEKYNQNQVSLYNDIQEKAIYSPCKYKIREYPGYKYWLRRKGSTIASKIFNLINDNNKITKCNHSISDNSRKFLETLVDITHRRIENSKKKIANEAVTEIDKNICFQPEINTTIKKLRLFNLVLQYSLKRKYITIYANIL